MRGLLKLMMAFCLVAGLMAGAMAYAAESASCGNDCAPAQLLQNDVGQSEGSPASHDAAPHRHTICHCHDIVAPMKLPAAPALAGRKAAPPPALESALADGMQRRALRPPIA